MTSSFARLLFVALALALGAGVAQAQSYPTKTVRIILPFPPGGPTDLLGRVISQKMTEFLGQPVIVDNRGGAGGNLGVELTAKAPPDGYTLVISSPLIAISPTLYEKLNYDPAKDLAPISRVANIDNVLLVHPSVPAKTLREFIALARQRPGKLNFGSGGAGTTTHLASELLKVNEKIDMVHVPYKGTGLALIGLMGGQVDMLVMAVAAAQGQIHAGKVRALAVLADKRSSVIPKVPTSKEAGVNNFEVPIWYGVLAPSGTPREIIARLNTEFTKTLKSPDVREKFAGAGVEPATSTPEEFASFIKSETVRYAKVIRAANIKAD